MDALGRFLVARRRWVIAATALLVLVSGALGAGVVEELTTGGFEDPGVESVRARELLDSEFDQAPPNLVLLVTANDGTVDDDAVRRLGVRVTNDLVRDERVDQVVSHWTLGPGSPLASSDRAHALVVARVTGDDDAVNEHLDELVPMFTLDESEASVRVGGFAAAFREVGDAIQEDLARAEAFAIPITLLLLIVVFGSVVAASLPVGVGIFAIFGTFLILRVVASFTDVSIFALNMVTAMGLGLAIDYSLFVVSRFREEMRAGHPTVEAVVRTVRTAGRTILFSGITVAVSLSALLIFPLAFLRSFAYAGIGVVFTAVFGAVVFLPAVLAALGPRVDAWTIWRRESKEVGEGFWHRMAMLVMRRPVPIATGVVVFLLLLGTPFLHVSLGLPNDRVLPADAQTRQVHDTLRTEFPTEEVQSIRVIVTDAGGPTGSFARTLSTMPGVARVDSAAGRFVDGGKVEDLPPVLAARFVSERSTWLQVVPSVDPFSPEAEELVADIRALDDPAAGQLRVGGISAELVDSKASLFDALPWALAIIAVATFLLLFAMFGSVVVPLKALVLNLLSLTATFGAMVWIFQDGHLSGVLGFTPTGWLDITTPILMFCIAFGLSMDYEVFLLSRIKETYDATGDNERSVAVGLERTGRIVTAAAVLISVVFLATATSRVSFIKLFGIGMALAVLMDAFVIRATLVPAFMRLAGRANWWLPSFLRPLHERVRIREAVEEEPSVEEKPAARKKPVARKKPTARKKPATRKKPAAKRKQAARKKPAAKRKKPAARKGEARKR